ncbi:MAG: response regulator [Rhodospirillales bacterium]|mgnify:FL=1|tara:strand:- start:761 stop:1693 length:933 start_codon:yes stop_codon:yes gene_type:complete
MAKLNFGNVGVFLVDGDASARQGVRHILFNEGCRDIRLGDDCKEVVAVLGQNDPDLIVGELRLPDGNFAAVTQKIRQGKIGHNPFVPIILVVVEDEDPKAIKAALDMGVDDVVSKPVSAVGLMARINRLVEKRRPFVVTEEYMGPKRVQDEGAKAIEAPNHLSRKLKGEKIGFLDKEMDVAAAEEDVKGCRLQFIGDEIKSLINGIAPRLEKGEFDRDLRNSLARVVAEAMRAQDQLENTRYEHVARLCSSLSGVAGQLRDTGDGSVDLRRALLLRPLSQAIQMGFAGGIASEEAAKIIVEKIGAGILKT